jgi:hypothetical protein
MLPASMTRASLPWLTGNPGMQKKIQAPNIDSLGRRPEHSGQAVFGRPAEHKSLFLADVDLVELSTVLEKFRLSVIPAGSNFCHWKQLDRWK